MQIATGDLQMAPGRIVGQGFVIGDLLSPEEHEAMDMTVDLWNALCGVAGDADSRGDDLRELAAHIHGIQRAVLANAAARMYSDRYRLLGGTVAGSGFVDVDDEVEAEDTDLRPLPEDVTGHTLGPGYTHEDGRSCAYHNRLGMWTPDMENECLRAHGGREGLGTPGYRRWYWTQGPGSEHMPPGPRLEGQDPNEVPPFMTEPVGPGFQMQVYGRTVEMRIEGHTLWARLERSSGDWTKWSRMEVVETEGRG